MTEKIFDIETVGHILQNSADDEAICRLNDRIEAYFLLFRNGVWYDCTLFLYPDASRDECEAVNWDAEEDAEENKIKEEVLAMYKGSYYEYIDAARERIEDESAYFDE